MTQAIITIDKNCPPLVEQLQYEKQLLSDTRADLQPRAHIWRSQQTLVVTKSESRLPGFELAKETLLAKGWPIVVRDTGGAAVPQSPETLNLSLIYKSQKGMDIEASYIDLCKPIMRALEDVGVISEATAVEGSFCDGKYNLAVKEGSQIKKIVGTSQKWTSDKVVLAHAVILSSIDTQAATDAINEFYRLAGSTEVKSADVVTSISEHLLKNHADTSNLQSRLISALAKHCEDF